MKPLGPLVHVCVALALAACGADLSIELPAQREGTETGAPLRLDFPAGQAVEHRLPFRVSGGVPPYDSSIEGCPDWVTLLPDQGILAGTAPVSERGRTFFCAYRVTDSGGLQEPQSVSYGLRLAVGSPAALDLPSPVVPPLRIGEYRSIPFPPASGGVWPYTYSFTCAGGALPSGMGFAPATRVFAGTPDAAFQDSCTYTVTDSAQPAATVSEAVEVIAAPTGPLTLPDAVFEGDDPGSLTVGRRVNVTFAEATGGVGPYTYELLCALPQGLGFSPNARILSGTPLEAYRGPDCTYRVTDSASPPAVVSRSVALIVDPLDLGAWRFRTRTVEPGGPCALPRPGTRTPVATLPHAQGGVVGQDVYDLLDRPHTPLLEFDRITRQLTYIHPPAAPILGTPNTYRYAVGRRNGNGEVNEKNADDVLCLDIQFDPGTSICPADPEADPPLQPSQLIHIHLRVRDDAYWDAAREEYRCPDTTAPAPSSAAQNVSNPVHTALAPVHARRAVDVAHEAVRDRVRGRSPGAPSRVAVSPSVDFASLSGRSAGFDYTGSSRSLSAGVETGAGSWQAGLVAAFTRTDLSYRAEASLPDFTNVAGECHPT